MKFDVEEILAKADLVEYVRRAGGEVRGGGNRYSSHCPLHGGDNRTAFSIYFQDGRWKWKCFTGDCGNGDAIKFVEVWQGLDFKRACEWISGGAIEDAEGMLESAKRRHEQAERDLQEAKEREEARRNELRSSERHIFYNKSRSQLIRDEWARAGIDDGMQDFWTLGGCDDFVYKLDGELFHTPTMTIPIFNSQKELMTIQHRLLNPKDPNDKYRPEKTGLHAHPFLAVPEMGYDGGIIWVMEGAKKGMVTWTRADTDWQCIGVPSQESYKGMIVILKPVGNRVIVVPDPNSARNPNSLRKAYVLAKGIGGRFLSPPQKFDDLILMCEMKQNDLYGLYKQARRT